MINNFSLALALISSIACFCAKAEYTESNNEYYADNCVLLAQKEFESWLIEHPYQKDAHKIKLQLLCGHEFGEPDIWVPELKVISSGCGMELLQPFPPFKRMHCVYGAQKGHPLYWCHFGIGPKVDAQDLTVEGDFLNEAKLLKEKFESLFGIEMHQLYMQNAFMYEDEYNSILISLEHKSESEGAYPLVVEIKDLELYRQSQQIQSIYDRLKQEEKSKQESELNNVDNTPVSAITEFGYGKLRFGDPIPVDEIVSDTRDEKWVYTNFEPMYGSRKIKDDKGFSIARKWYWRDGRGLCEIQLSSGANSEAIDSYDEALSKFEDFKAKIEKELSMTLPATIINVPKDQYDKTHAEYRQKEADNKAKGILMSHEWPLFSLAPFDYNGVRFFIHSSAWTKHPTTIHMQMRKLETKTTREQSAEEPGRVQPRLSRRNNARPTNRQQRVRRLQASHKSADAKSTQQTNEDREAERELLRKELKAIQEEMKKQREKHMEEMEEKD